MALLPHIIICVLWGCMMNYALAADMSISSHHGALLVKNGKQTSCEIALIDNRAGFVAATCVVDGNGNLDTNARYEIYTDDGDNESPKSAPIISSSIKVHPQFKMSNFANNIAVVQFSVDVKDWSNKVAVDHGSWASSLYVRRYMANKNAMRWAKPKTGRSLSTRPECAASSGLYASNYFDFSCSSDAAGTMVGSQCGVPYGTVYGQVNDQMAIGGIYSHSVAEGDSICSPGRVVHYYLYLSNYLAFAQNVLGRGVPTLSTGNFAVNSDAWYAMEPESFATPSGTRILGGNAFNRANGEAMLTATEEAQSENNQQNDNDSGNQDPPNNDQPDNNDPPSNNDQPTSSAARNPQPTSDASNNNQASTTSNSSNSSSSTSNSNDQVSTTTNASDQSNDNEDSDASASNKDDTNNEQLASGSSDHKNNNGDSLNEGNKEAADSNDDSTANDADSSNSSETDASSAKSSKKLSGGQVAGIVIGVLLFCILAAVGGIYGMRWYREFRIKKWSPDAVRQILESHIVDNEAGNTPSTKFELPSYRNHRGTMFVDAGPHSHD